MRALPIMAALLLAACSSPVVTSAGPESVTVRYDPALYSREEVRAKAVEHCKLFGSEGAAFVSSSQANALAAVHDVFACGS